MNSIHANYRRGDMHTLLALGIFVGLLAWAADDLHAWLAPHLARLFHMSGLSPATVAKAACTLPTEHEQMVVILYWRDGQLRHRCAFTGSRGTYAKPAKGPRV